MSAGRAPLRVGILGVGAIGRMLATALDRGRPGAILCGIADQDRPAAEKFAAMLKQAVAIVSIDELVRHSDLVIEAAGQAALPDLVPKALASGTDLLVLSVGGLLGHDDWLRQAQERGCRIYVPSGAIAGLDGIKSARIGRLDSVLLTSRKPVAALRGSKYVAERGIDLDSLTDERVLFEGTPEEACKNFPATSNVAASLRLAAGAGVNISVRVIATPHDHQNVHCIEAAGEFGKLRVVIENVPSASNPRTSALAAMSALATLDGIVGGSRVGT